MEHKQIYIQKLNHSTQKKPKPTLTEGNHQEIKQISSGELAEKTKTIEDMAQFLTKADEEIQQTVRSLSKLPHNDIKNLLETNAHYLRTIASSLPAADYKKAYHERATVLCALMDSLNTAIAEIDRKLDNANTIQNESLLKPTLEKKRTRHTKHPRLKFNTQLSEKRLEVEKLNLLRMDYTIFMRRLILDPAWDIGNNTDNLLSGKIVLLRIQTIIQTHLTDIADLKPEFIKLALKQAYSDIQKSCKLTQKKIYELMEEYPNHETFKKLIALEKQINPLEYKKISSTLFEKEKRPQLPAATPATDGDSPSEIDKLTIINRDITKSELDAVFLATLGSNSNPRFIDRLLESRSNESLRKELANIFQSIEKNTDNYRKIGKEIALTNKGMQQIVILLCKSTNVTIQQNINSLRDRLEALCLQINVPLRDRKMRQLQQNLASQKEDKLIRSPAYIPSPFYIFFENERMKEGQRNLKKVSNYSAH